MAHVDNCRAAVKVLRSPTKTIFVSTLCTYLFCTASFSFEPHGEFKAPSRTRAQLEQQIAQHPNDPLAYCDRGDFYMLAAESELAMSDYSRALQIDPKCARALLRRSQYYLGERDYVKALRDAEAGLKLNTSDQADLMMQKIDCLQRLGRHSECVQAFETLIKSTGWGVGPQDRMRLHLERAELYIRINKPQEALADVAIAEPYSVSAYRMAEIRAKAHLALKQPKLAVADYTHAINKGGKMRNPDRLSKMYHSRAALYKMLGETKLADADLASAKKIDSEYGNGRLFSD